MRFRECCVWGWPALALVAVVYGAGVLAGWLALVLLTR
jgi:hypothetical protein